MKHTAGRILRAVTALAAIPAVLTAHSTIVLAAAIVLLALIATVATCWTITDPGRTRRLAALIKATRAGHSAAQPPRRRS